MYLIINENALKALHIMFERTSDDSTLMQVYKGFKDIARISAFFSMKEELNVFLIQVSTFCAVDAINSNSHLPHD
jgi:hypothetical protein